MDEFLQRLRERKLVQWALAYVAAAFALIQVVDIIAQRFELPDAVGRLSIVALGIGFFVALVLAWYHGERGAQRVSGVELLIIALLLGIGGGLLWRVAGGTRAGKAPEPDARVAAAASRAPPATQPIPPKSIAVLPFESLSDDKSNAYFATGMQDEILTRLANIRDLKVISRTSTEKYASHPPDLKTVGLELGVASVLEGTVQKAGDAVHINLQLIDTGNDSHRWAQSYDRDLKDIFAVERDVAEKVAGALQATLMPEEAVLVANVPTRDTQAHDLYLRALAFSNHANDQYGLSAVLMPQAIDLLQQALARDPAFAKAAALLGRAHMYMYFFGPDRTEERLAAARTAAEQSLRLQPDLGEGHFALAFYWYWGFRDYDRALAELALARRTMPHSFDIEELDAAIARRQGKWERTLEGLRRAAEFDPRNASPPFELGWTYAHLRRYADADGALARAGELSADPALAQIRRAQNAFWWKGDLTPLRATLAALSPDSDAYRSMRPVFYDLAWWSHDFAAAAKVAADDRSETWPTSRGNSVLPRALLLAWAEEALGHAARARELYAEIRAVYAEKVRARPSDWNLHSVLGLACAGLGMKDEAIAEGRRAVELLPISRDAFAGTEYETYLAQIYARVGEKDQAIAQLQHLMEIPAGRCVSAALLRLDPTWDALRHEARFQALVDKGDRPL
jgi:TolB-like protein/Flp pilus assembly protein TadD